MRQGEANLGAGRRQVVCRMPWATQHTCHKTAHDPRGTERHPRKAWLAAYKGQPAVRTQPSRSPTRPFVASGQVRSEVLLSSSTSRGCSIVMRHLLLLAPVKSYLSGREGREAGQGITARLKHPSSVAIGGADAQSRRDLRSAGRLRRRAPQPHQYSRGAA